MYFDNGYDFMERAIKQGYKQMPEYGEWPHSVYVYKVNPDHTRKVMHYCEGDVASPTKNMAIVEFSEYLKTLPKLQEA